MTDVIKSDRRRERYSQAKLRRSIECVARDVAVVGVRRRDLVRHVVPEVHERASRRSTVRSSDLRRDVLGRLDGFMRLGEGQQEEQLQHGDVTTLGVDNVPFLPPQSL